MTGDNGWTAFDKDLRKLVATRTNVIARAPPYNMKGESPKRVMEFFDRYSSGMSLLGFPAEEQQVLIEIASAASKPFLFKPNNGHSKKGVPSSPPSYPVDRTDEIKGYADSRSARETADHAAGGENRDALIWGLLGPDRTPPSPGPASNRADSNPSPPTVRPENGTHDATTWTRPAMIPVTTRTVPPVEPETTEAPVDRTDEIVHNRSSTPPSYRGDWSWPDLTGPENGSGTHEEEKNDEAGGSEHTLIDHVRIANGPTSVAGTKALQLHPRWTTPIPVRKEPEEGSEFSGLTEGQLIALYRDRLNRFTKAVSKELVDKGSVLKPVDSYAYRDRRPETTLLPSARDPQPEETTPAEAGEAARWQTSAASPPYSSAVSTSSSERSAGGSYGTTSVPAERTYAYVLGLLLGGAAFLALGLVEAYRLARVPVPYLGPMEAFGIAIVLMIGGVVATVIG